MKIYNIKEKIEYAEEIARLTFFEWGKVTNSESENNEKIMLKKEKILNNINNEKFCKLILLDRDVLVGFVSIFPKDGEYRQDLTPWYATLYVKKEYRGKGYSKILNDAILKEARKKGYKVIYLKTDLNNFYEKFGFKYIETMENGEKLYYKNLD